MVNLIHTITRDQYTTKLKHTSSVKFSHFLIFHCVRPGGYFWSSLPITRHKFFRVKKSSTFVIRRLISSLSYENIFWFLKCIGSLLIILTQACEGRCLSANMFCVGLTEGFPASRPVMLDLAAKYLGGSGQNIQSFVLLKNSLAPCYARHKTLKTLEQTLYIMIISKSAIDQCAFQGIQLNLHSLKVCLRRFHIAEFNVLLSKAKINDLDLESFLNFYHTYL